MTLLNLTKVANECDRYGIPFIAEMYPGGFNPPAEMINIDNLKLAARMAADLGADMLKMPYRPGYEAVVQGCYGLPIVVLGGAKTNSQEAFLENIEDAMRCGSKGVAIGRNVWGHKDPAAMVRALNAIVHENKDAKTALHGVEEGKAHYEQCKDGRRVDAEPMPLDELTYPVAACVWAGRHGKAVQMPLNVLDEGRCRGVSPLRLLPERLQHHHIQIPLQPAL
jgi:hypothetical protein